MTEMHKWPNAKSCLRLHINMLSRPAFPLFDDLNGNYNILLTHTAASTRPGAAWRSILLAARPVVRAVISTDPCNRIGLVTIITVDNDFHAFVVVIDHVLRDRLNRIAPVLVNQGYSAVKGHCVDQCRTDNSTLIVMSDRPLHSTSMSTDSIAVEHPDPNPSAEGSTGNEYDGATGRRIPEEIESGRRRIRTVDCGIGCDIIYIWQAAMLRDEISPSQITQHYLSTITQQSLLSPCSSQSSPAPSSAKPSWQALPPSRTIRLRLFSLPLVMTSLVLAAITSDLVSPTLTPPPALSP
nr:hypothetical protein CFP56_21870 [Quercus suber]